MQLDSTCHNDELRQLTIIRDELDSRLTQMIDSYDTLTADKSHVCHTLSHTNHNHNNHINNNDTIFVCAQKSEDAKALSLGLCLLSYFLFVR